MSQTFDVILKSGTVVNQDGEGVCDIGIKGGRIAALGALGQASAGEVIDCKGLHILPGVIDTQVHFREPGLTHKEDLESGSRSAVMGGVTAVFEMPNTNPLTVTEEAFTAKVKAGHHRMHCDYAFFIGGTRDNVDQLPELERAPGCAGVKVFIGSSTGSLLVEDDPSLRRILSVIRRRASFHAEDEYRLNERKHLRIEGDPRSHPVWRDEVAALQATQRLVARQSPHRRAPPRRSPEPARVRLAWQPAPPQQCDSGLLRALQQPTATGPSVARTSAAGGPASGRASRVAGSPTRLRWRWLQQLPAPQSAGCHFDRAGDPLGGREHPPPCWWAP